MTNIGIVGSSFSQGGDGRFVDGEFLRYTDFLHEYLKNEMPEHSFYNAARSGRGTERYLNNLVHLKERHDISHLLIEVIQNRSVNYFWYNEDQYETDLNNWNDDLSYQYSLLEDDDIVTYINGVDSSYFQKSVYSDLSVNDLQKWKDISAYSLYKSSHLRVLAARDITNTVKLCKMLNIIPIKWSFDLRMLYDCFKIDAEYELVECMENNGISYKDNTCDGLHLTDFGHRWAAKNYFAPLFRRFV